VKQATRKKQLDAAVNALANIFAGVDVTSAAGDEKKLKELLVAHAEHKKKLAWAGGEIRVRSQLVTRLNDDLSGLFGAGKRSVAKDSP
jgi:hypothetical protein